MPVDQAALQSAQQYAQDHSEAWLTLRCLEALAELALVAGDADGCITHADQLLALASRGNLRELIGQAHRLRGLAWFAGNAYDSARQELTLALTQAGQIGCIRLAWQCHRALARAAAAFGDEADKNDSEARALHCQIVDSLRGSGLTANLEAAQ